MSDLAVSSLTNSQLSGVSRESPQHGWLATIRLLRQRARERAALAQLNARELADFGASSADVYRELHSSFWTALPPR